MSGACSTYVGENGVKRAWWGNLRERDHLEDPGVGERIILNWIFRKWDMGLEQDGLALNRDGWKDFVDVIMNFPVP